MPKKTYYLTKGFRADCIRLLSEFDKTDSIRFENFCNVWKKMQFSLIFCGRQTYSELLEFSEEVIQIAKQFVFPPYTFKERIGGLYLLYGLYYKIPMRDSVKIRINSNEWTSLIELKDELREGEHLDANYILCTLIHDEAFANVIFEQEWGLEKYYRQKQTPTNNYSIMPTLLEMSQEGNSFREVNELAKKYRQATSSLARDQTAAANLKLFKENFIEEILEDVRKLEVDRQKDQISSMQAAESEKLESDGKKEKRKYDYNKVRPRIGDGFDMETSEEDEDEEEEDDELDSLDGNERNYSETLEDDNGEVEKKKAKLMELPPLSPHIIFKKDPDIGGSSSD